MYVARSNTFKKQYQKLSPKVQKQFAERLQLFLENKSHPLLHTHQLAGRYKGFYSFNVNADIRAVFEFKAGNIIYFIAIGSHSELYE